MLTITRLAIIAAALAGTSLQAATITPDAGWQLFLFGGVGSPISDSNGDEFFDFTVTTASTLKVTDAFVIGDRWQFFLGGNSIGSSGPFNIAGPETGDPDVAFAGATYSTFSFNLAPGTYQLTGITLDSPAGSGGAYVQVTSGAVPEPASWAMLITGFGLIGAVARRRGVASAA